ncbi:MAG: hypothetical protein O3C04_06645 [Crenarchaeota archaeon]|nr:hypothetical protein [Thermoproteota archaeon]
MIKSILTVIICLGILFSIQATYAEEELPLLKGKNIKEWESISAALVAENRVGEAIIYLDKILEQEPDNLKALNNKAGLLIILEKFEESLNLSNKVLKIDPDRISTLTNKAIALKMLKEYEKSFLTFSKIMVLEPENQAVQKSRANLLSGTPTISTSDSKYYVHVLITVRDENGNLVATTESTNARYLPSLFTEKWWEKLDEQGGIENTKDGELFTKTNRLIPETDYIGMPMLQRQMSGYDISIFEVFTPMIQVEESDLTEVQWTIIKK